MINKQSLNFLKLSIFLLFILSFCTFSVYSQSKTVGLTKHFFGGQENGYVLFTAVGSDTTYLINKCGKKIHSWYSEYTPGLSTYLLPNGHLLKTGSYDDTSFGTAGGRGGIIEEFDWDGNLVWRYKIFNDTLCQHHDITPMSNGNILVLTWHSISKAHAMALGRDSMNFGPGQTDLWGERIIELKPIGTDSASIVWQWDLFDHIIQNSDPTLPNFGIASQHPELMNINYALNMMTHDWIHANSLDYNKKLDQIVISCHNISEIWVIDHSGSTAVTKSHSGGNSGRGGDLLYRWGNPEAYHNGSLKDRKLFRQHNAHWIANGLKDSGSIMVFNNGWNRDTSYSSVDIIKTPVNNLGQYAPTLPYGPTAASWIYKDSVPTRFYSQIISGAQRLQNGNTLICSGVQGRFFEVTQQKKTVWEYKCPIGGNFIQTDGQTPNNNAVFRCTFYPSNYIGFNNKSLSPTSTIEKNSYIYSCNYENVPPKPFTLSPFMNETSVIANPVLQIKFDESVLKKSGIIKIFQNNTLLETVSIDSNAVDVNNNIVTIYQKQAFKINSVISIIIPAGGFRDSSNNLNKIIDSSAWHFYTVKPELQLLSLSPNPFSFNIRTDGKLNMVFKDSVYKSSDGKIRIYENTILKETIPISSSNIIIQGKQVTIIPSGNFAYDAVIEVEVDTCFINAKHAHNQIIANNSWLFNTLTTPKIIGLSPSNLSSGVAVNTTLSINFDRDIVFGDLGHLMIYENNLLIDSILTNGPRAMINGNTISFDLNSDFKHSARISVSLRPNVLKDTFGTYFKGIDSSKWSFTTIKQITSIKNTLKGNVYNIYPNPSKGNLTLISNYKVETIEVFNLNGQKVNSVNVKLNDTSYEIKIDNAAPGSYTILVNGLYSSNIIIE